MTSNGPPQKKPKLDTVVGLTRFFGFRMNEDVKTNNELWRMFRLIPKAVWTTKSFKQYHQSHAFKTGKSVVGHTKKERMYRNFLRHKPQRTPGTAAGAELMKINLEKDAKCSPAVAAYYPRWHTMKDAPESVKDETEFSFADKVEVAAHGISAFTDSMRVLWLKFCETKNIKPTPRSFTLFLSKYGEDLPVAGVIVEVIKMMADGIGKNALVPSEDNVECTCATCPSHSLNGSILDPIPDVSREDIDDILDFELPCLDSPDPFDVLGDIFNDDGLEAGKI
nr:hypothetical protein [Sicyoidochytrium minutum DNA virus]